MGVIEQSLINRLSEILNDLANDAVSDYDKIREELVTYNINILELPREIDTFNKRMEVMALIKDNLESRNQQSQENMIDLQTLVNRRDVAHSTATNIVRSLGNSMSNNAATLL